MNIKELTREQLTELKCNYYTEQLENTNESPSYYELANIDDFVSDDEIFQAYDGIIFTKDDFFCEQ